MKPMIGIAPPQIHSDQLDSGELTGVTGIYRGLELGL